MSRLALSHSRLSDFNQCPRKFKLKYIDKLSNMNPKDMDKNIHLVRGQNVHKALENYVVQVNAGTKDIQPSSMPEVQSAREYVDGLFKSYDQVLPELQLAVNDQYNQITWFDTNAYWRAILDLIAIGKSKAIISDYKTGKFAEYDGGPTGYGQLHLSGLLALELIPHVDEVETNYLFVDHRKIVSKTFTRDDLPRLRAHFDAEHAKVNAETVFAPIKNEYCKWCDANKAQCAYSTKMDVAPLVFQPKKA